MSDVLLEIEPRELKFVVEAKKQSSCSVRLFNKSNHYVAFKVKTTSPKKYCVRPNVGVMQPKSTFSFKVIMQAPRVSPPEMTSKDKFLVQSTIVAVGTTEEDITSTIFVKDKNEHVEEHKLRVVLISPPNSPTISPLNGVLDQFLALDTTPLKNQVFRGNDDIRPQFKMTKDIVEPKLEDAQPIGPAKVLNLEPVNDSESLALIKDMMNLEEKISALETKLEEAQGTISKLTSERRLLTQDSENLKQELALLRSRKAVRRVQVGFPFGFVCMVAVICVFLGHVLHIDG